MDKLFRAPISMVRLQLLEREGIGGRPASSLSLFELESDVKEARIPRSHLNKAEEVLAADGVTDSLGIGW